MEAPTKLETIELRRGTVVVKGYSEIGRVDGRMARQSSSPPSRCAMSTGQPRGRPGYHAAQGAGDQRRSAVSYVDYEEIAGLVGGIDFMGKGEENASALPNYEAQFRTRSNLEVVSYDNNNQRMISVRAVQVTFPSGEVSWATAAFPILLACGHSQANCGWQGLAG